MRLSQARDSSTVRPEREKFIINRATDAVTMGGDGGNRQDLFVDVLHDLTGLLPNGGRRGRLNKKYGETGTEICHVEGAAGTDPLPPPLLDRGLFLLQVENLLC